MYHPSHLPCAQFSPTVYIYSIMQYLLGSGHSECHAALVALLLLIGQLSTPPPCLDL